MENIAAIFVCDLAGVQNGSTWSPVQSSAAFLLVRMRLMSDGVCR